jgi:hypothetical protein
VRNALLTANRRIQRCHLCTVPCPLSPAPFLNLEPTTGIEPVTSSLPRTCSTD